MTVELDEVQETAEDGARRLSAKQLAAGFVPKGLHVYADARGAEIYRRIRLKHPDTGEKWVRPMWRNGARWELGEPPALAHSKKPLYALPALAKADPALLVFFAEGEACADKIAKLGGLATTAGSAQSDEHADFAPLAGRHVIILPDNDKPGRDHAQRVGEKLLALGCRVEILELDGLPEGGDIVDYVQAHPDATAADILALPRRPFTATDRTDKSPFVSSVSTPAGHVSENAWPKPKPLPLELLPVQAFDFDLLPMSLRGWVRDCAERFQCAPDYLAVAAMVSAGSLIGRRIAVRPQRRTDWTEYGNLWGLVVGRPGSMKSPAIAEATRFLRRFEADAAIAYQAAQRDYAAEKERFEVRMRKSHKDATKDASVGVLTSVDAPAEPLARRFIVNDSTVEALHLIACENAHGFMALRDEIPGLLRNLDREEFARDRGFYLESWAGNSTFTMDRIARGRNLSARLNLSLLGGAQPSRIQAYVAAAVRGSSGDDGLLQRFGLFVWPDAQAEWRNVDRYPDTEARIAAANAFEHLRDLSSLSAGAEDDDHGDCVPFLRLDERAQAAFDEWLETLMRELRAGDLHSALESHLAKYKKLAPSLALCLHLAEGGTRSITHKAMVSALAWTEYLRTHAERLYRSGTAIEVRSAKAILAKLRAGAIEYVEPKDPNRLAFDARSIYRPCWVGLDRDATYAGLELLADLNHLRRETVATEGRAGTLWLVNPETLQ